MAFQCIPACCMAVSARIAADCDLVQVPATAATSPAIRTSADNRDKQFLGRVLVALDRRRLLPHLAGVRDPLRSNMLACGIVKHPLGKRSFLRCVDPAQDGPSIRELACSRSASCRSLCSSSLTKLHSPTYSWIAVCSMSSCMSASHPGSSSRALNVSAAQLSACLITCARATALRCRALIIASVIGHRKREHFVSQRAPRFTRLCTSKASFPQ